jgi:hypothetical protein
MRKNGIKSVEKFFVDNIHWKWRDELLFFIENLL